MTKLKELLDINERLENYFNVAFDKKYEFEKLKDRKRKLLIIQEHTYKNIFDYIKEWIVRVKLDKEIQEAEISFEESITDICDLRNIKCNHDILLLINKYNNKNNQSGDYLCPICGKKALRPLENNSSNVIDETTNPNKDKFFGEISELEIEYLSKIKQMYLRDEEATIDDFFDICVQEKPSKCKRKTLI